MQRWNSARVHCCQQSGRSRCVSGGGGGGSKLQRSRGHEARSLQASAAFDRLDDGEFPTLKAIKPLIFQHRRIRSYKAAHTMADDGMLLNFSVGDGPLLTKPSFKGGRWKDRHTAKKAALHRQSKIAGNSKPKTALQTPPTSGEEDVHVPRPAKRQRVDENFKSASTGRNAASNTARPNTGQNDGVRGPPKQVISSLFSFNPSSATQADAKKDEQQDAPVEPSNAPLTSELDTFTSLGLSTTLASHLLNKLNMKAPTAIQKAAITQLLKEDSDAFIQAETGSGKTLAYLLPIVQRIMSLSAAMKEQGQLDGTEAVHRDSGLFAVILAPTRELSKQISIVLESLLRCAHWIVAGTVIGGEKKKSEKARLRKGLNILVATPGRLADHLNNTEALDVSNVRWLVLDEGDRLMELGFEDEIQKIVSMLNLRVRKTPIRKIPGLPTRRTTVLCSATMKINVQRLGEISLKDAVHIQADPAERAEGDDPEPKQAAFSAPAQLKQSYAIVPAKLRLVTLVGLLKRTFVRYGSCMKVIVFMSCADSVDFHFKVLTRQQVDQTANGGSDDENKEETAPQKQMASAETTTHSPAPGISGKGNPVTAFRLHGSLPQALRTSTLASFTRSNDPSLLICTDVASRGLDLPNVDFVIEYDPPFSKDDHLHRIGRTARAGRDGRALIFLMPGSEEGYIDILKEERRDSGTGLTRHDANELLKKGFPDLSVSATIDNRAATQGWEERATDWQLDVERWALENPAILEQARRAYQSHVRAYATHIAAERALFDIKALHLGHLAKAFALRDKPGSIKVPGLRQGAGSVKAERKAAGGGRRASGVGKEGKGESKRQEHEMLEMTDEQEARRLMRRKAKMQMAGASEFNLG